MHPQGDDFTRLVLFDGECAVCDATVQFVLDRDPEGRFHFAPLQGETAQAVLSRHPIIPRDLDSLIFVQRRPDGSEAVSWHSAAVIGIAEGLGGGFALATALRAIPSFLRDPFYRGFAAMRYKLFGRNDSCRMLEPEWEARFHA
ncbi:MAG: thiol-disulfide oxidoreductase DCC family protein [Myxococcota bacterium]